MNSGRVISSRVFRLLFCFYDLRFLLFLVRSHPSRRFTTTAGVPDKLPQHQTEGKWTQKNLELFMLERQMFPKQEVKRRKKGA